MFCSKFFLNQCRILIKRFHNINLANMTAEARIETLRKMALPKTRENPVIMYVDTPEFKSIFTNEFNTLISLFKEYGYEIRVAGGAVRDILMGKQPKDLDLATTATPTQMKDMFRAEKVRLINMNGEKHGTITPRINDKENFEVTTLRIDVTTDGRHAEVQFTTDWLLDSLRRDLTINSMFLGVDGSVYDYFYGYDDLRHRRVAFVGDAVSRIQEDYLRILRYFRFYGRIAVDSNQHEQETLKAISDNAKGLEIISGERIWTELKKIAEGNFAGDLVLTIIECGIHKYIGFPDNPNIEELKRVWNHVQHLQVNGITLLSSLLNTRNEVLALHGRLKLSAFERDLALFIVENRGPILHPNPLIPYKKLIFKAKSKPLDTKKWVIELLKYSESPYVRNIESWDIPQFQISGVMLKRLGVESGRFMGAVMNELKDIWADSDFRLTTEELLKEVPRIVNELQERKNKNGP